MEMWNYKSLEWIHEVRQANYEKTREQAPETIIKESLEASRDLITKLNLRLLHPNNVIPRTKAR